MNNCFLVHGFNVSDGGKNTTDRLIPQVKKLRFKAVEADYRWMFILGVLWRNKRIAEKLAVQVVSGDIGIGHSNGCAILSKASIKGANFEKLILINPALDKNFEFPKHIKEIHVIHTKHDKPVVAAKWLRKLIVWRNSFLWGEMGHTGYLGNDCRVVNHDVSEISNGHSDIFRDKNLYQLNKIITAIFLGKQ